MTGYGYGKPSYIEGIIQQGAFLDVDLVGEMASLFILYLFSVSFHVCLSFSNGTEICDTGHI